MADTVATLDQVRAYMLAHGWERRPDEPAGWENWVHPTYGDNYPHSGTTFRTVEAEREGWGRLDLEVFTIHEGRCEHEILADILGRPDPATLLARIEAMQRDLTVLARVGDLYLTALDDDPANEYLTLGGAMLGTEIREAVERQGYDVRWTEADA